MIEETTTFLTFHAPELSEWSCELFGCGNGGIVFTPKKGDEPNWFWRWMQFLCFGNKWVKKLKPKEPSVNHQRHP